MISTRQLKRSKTLDRVSRLVVFACTLLAVGAAEDAAYWRQVARDDLNKYMDLERNTNIAKNVILFVGDGLGVNTVMAARVLRGQLQNNTGEETVLEFEKLPHVALSKVYTTDKQVPDSAATATAMLSGVKTISRLLGYDNTVTKDTCVHNKTAELTTILDWSHTAGMSTGIVSTARITHATPASAFAHVTNRNWEADVSVSLSARSQGCKDIAHQLVVENSHIQVILGGGRENFLPNTVVDPITGKLNNVRGDGLNLIQEWKDDKTRRAVQHEYVSNKGQFDNINPNDTDYILGLFDTSHMSYDLDRDSSAQGQPSLADMTTKAIQVLRKNTDGFFLFVEGGRIDHAHHANNAKRALYDTLAFDDAIKVAMEMTEERDTLIIVTGDHSHVFTIAGYSDRGNDILVKILRCLNGVGHDQTAGCAGTVDPGVDADGYSYTTLGYTNGPGYRYAPRYSMHSTDTADDNYRQEAAVPLLSETHGGEDVPIYSRGPMSHLLNGAKEQNTIAFVMAHAACVGDTGIPCDKGRTSQSNGVPRTTTRPCDTGQTGGDGVNSGNEGGANKLSILVVFLLTIVGIHITTPT